HPAGPPPAYWPQQQQQQLQAPGQAQPYMHFPPNAQPFYPPGMQYPGQWWPGGPAVQPWGGAGSHLGALEHAGSIEARTIAADSTKRSIRTWQEAGAVSMYVLRGGLFVPSMSTCEISHMIRFIADPSQRLIDMITPPIANIDMDAFSPPVEQGTSAVSRTPEVHFQTFVNVLVKLIQQGDADSKGGVSQGRRDGLIEEFQTMAKTLSEYMTTHFNSLLPKQQLVRGRVIFAANRDINDFFGLLLDTAAPVKRAFPNAAPPEGGCAGLTPPAFTLLRELTSRGSCSLLGRMDIALEVPRLGGATTAAKQLKRKANAGGAHPPAARPRTDDAVPAWSFVSGLERERTPEGTCHFAWRRQ
ncbi:unnamed protein product, partial [Laminaria digitata]